MQTDMARKKSEADL